MIKLNIIPDKIKKEIKSIFVYNVIKKSFYILIIFFSIMGAILMISEHVLLSALAKEINGTTLDFKSAANSSQNKVNEINTKLLSLELVQGDFTRWSILYNFISKRRPDGIVFTDISIDKTSSSIIFKGQAKTRDSLLAFKALLENSTIFEKVNFPIKNLLQKENINFEIESKFKIHEIK